MHKLLHVHSFTTTSHCLSDTNQNLYILLRDKTKKNRTEVTSALTVGYARFSKNNYLDQRKAKDQNRYISVQIQELCKMNIIN